MTARRAYLVETGMRSERRACEVVGLRRSVFRYRPREKQDETLRGRLNELASKYPRYGYKLLHQMLRREGLVINAKRTYRIYLEERLQVKGRKRKRIPRDRRAP